MAKRSPAPDDYFQVPLCIFAFGPTMNDRLNTIITWGCWYAGHVQWNRMTDAYRDSLIASVKAIPDRARGINFQRRSDLELVGGSLLLGITFYNLQNSSELVLEFEQFRDRFESLYGKDCKVRIRKDLVYEARDRKGISAEELSVFAAILSVIGKKRTPVRITQETIRRRALGYRSARIAEQEQRRRKDNLRPLSDWQTRKIIRSLHQRGFFHRVKFGRRVTYYGIGQNAEAFQKAVIRRLTLPRASIRFSGVASEAVTAEVRRLRAANETIPPSKTEDSNNAASVDLDLI